MARANRHSIPGCGWHITHRCHKREFLLKWVENYLADGKISRQEEWTQSIAVGSRPFVECVKELLGFRGKGREIGDGAEVCQLCEPATRYSRHFEIKNDDMSPENTFDWRTNTYIMRKHNVVRPQAT